VGYVTALAKKAKNEGDLMTSLGALDVPQNAKTQRFVREVRTGQCTLACASGGAPRGIMESAKLLRPGRS
jgi:hypothetical protein